MLMSRKNIIMKKYLFVIAGLLLLSGCEDNDVYIPAGPIGKMLGIILVPILAIIARILLSFIPPLINRGAKNKDAEIIRKFNKRDRNPRKIEAIENNMKFSENTEVSVKIYRYKKMSITFLIIGLSLLVLGFLFRDAEGYVEIPVYYHGTIFNIFAVIMLVLTVIIYLSENLIEYKTHTYKLYNDRIECYNDQDIELFSIKISDIYKIDYIYTEINGGQSSNRIAFVLKSADGSELHRIEIKGLRNISSKKSFHDEFSEHIKNFI
jgi:hypothetical protein